MGKHPVVQGIGRKDASRHVKIAVDPVSAIFLKTSSETSNSKIVSTKKKQTCSMHEVAETYFSGMPTKAPRRHKGPYI